MPAAQPIYTDNPGSLPAAYPVPGDMLLRLSSVVARFNGAGASGPFHPCLSLYTNDDRLLGRWHPNQPLAVGDTAVVSYGPF